MTGDCDSHEDIHPIQYFYFAFRVCPIVWDITVPIGKKSVIFQICAQRTPDIATALLLLHCALPLCR